MKELAEPLSKEAQSAVLHRAHADHNPHTDRLSQNTFLAGDGHQPSWAIQGFREVPALRFTPAEQSRDPLDIGWTSDSIFNPSLMPHNDRLHVFYRTSPRKESLSSRIGHACFTTGVGWIDDHSNPIMYPTLDNENLGVEDPKIYRGDDSWVLFYNGIFTVSSDDRARYASPGYPVGAVGCDINVAISDDLQTWTKLGPIANRSLTRLWAKGAVIPRDRGGRAVRIGGQYLMFLSEGCNGVTHVGRSDDLISWYFEPQEYLDLDPLAGHLHEVATAIVDGDTLVIDFFYSDPRSQWSAGQASYHLDDPFHQLEIAHGGTLAWGGLVEWNGVWTFAQGWDARPGNRELLFYSTGGH